jgi:hypothetical protein
MSSTPRIRVTQPNKVIRKPEIKQRELLIALAKTIANLATVNLSNVPENVVDIGASLGLKHKPEELAWLLILHSLKQAIESLVKDYRQIDTQVTENIIVALSEYCLSTFLINKELTIYPGFFDDPIESLIIKSNETPVDPGNETYFLEAVKTPFAEWLESFRLNKAEIKAISDRLPTDFFYALLQEWKENSDKYTPLVEELSSPFNAVIERESKKELAWRLYSVWLQNQVNQRIFDEAFTLKDIYVPLRGYYEPKAEGENDKTKRIVVDLEKELEEWLNTDDKTDTIRVISGGPGSGKSSFTKMFAAKQAKEGVKKRNFHVLFIPLHLFNPEDDLVDGITKFIKLMRDIPLPPNPLEEEIFVLQLLIIFDGLDELAMQGRIAEEVAQKFVSEVQKQVSGFNSSQVRLRVLMSGRELVVQRNKSEFRKPKQILHILPYFVAEEEINQKNYIDEQNLLEEDQRQRWWQFYGAASGHGYTSLPEELDKGHLKEITSQPLLNYLVALSYVRGELVFSEDSNLNEVYADLLKQVYERVWADENSPYKNLALKGIEEKDFVRILEGIAVAAWHGGDGRTTTVAEIEKNCDSDTLQRVLNIFKQDKKASLTRLLTAFYFRQSGLKGSEETFEFTHKSFGEYLTAKRIVDEVKRLHEMPEVIKKLPLTINWNEKEALKDWAKLCGSTAMDEYIFNFVLNEMRLKDKAEVGKWQQSLCHLIGFMLRYGMPMEKLEPRPNFQEENRLARNAEEALLAVLNACARVTEEISHIEWHSPEAFGAWISRLQGQRIDAYAEVFCLSCLSFLDLQGCILVWKDFVGANLEGAILEGAILERGDS